MESTPLRALLLPLLALPARAGLPVAPEIFLPAYHLAAGQALPAPVPRAADGALPPGAPDPLDAPVASFRVWHTPIASAFLTVSRSYGITFALDPALKGDVALEVKNGTVRDVIDALTRAQGFYWQREGRLIAIHRNVVRFYEIDYPQMTRSAQGSSNVVLSAQASANASSFAPSSLPAGAASNPAGNGYLNQNDQTNISIQQQNQTTFWSDVQSELASLAQTGESVSINKLAGLAVVTAPPARQDDFRAFIEIVNRRISRQVRISARVIEVELNAQHQLGVDWALAATRIGAFTLSGFSTSTAFTSINGQTLIPSAVSGTLSAGKVSAAIQALEEQGQVRAVSNPSVISLSNQTAFVKVGTEQTFFSLANSTIINQTSATTPYSTTQASYTQNAITIGTVLYVTPEVNSDGTITVDVLPAITQLIGVDTSPDGQQTAPRMDIKALSTIARLHPDESVMIGGLIYDETSADTRKVPFLGDLPVVGRAFNTVGSAKTRSELVIFLTAETVR